MGSQSPASHQAGFTLIEILVTLVVLSIGLLGIAGMQAYGMRSNHAAYTKTQATNLAIDMADRIRANSKGIAHYAGLDTDNADTIPANPGCLSDGCSAEELASYDKYEWSQPLQSDSKPLLPAGRGIISRDGDEFTVTILWREPQLEGITRRACIEDQATDVACFQLRFIP